MHLFSSLPNPHSVMAVPPSKVPNGWNSKQPVVAGWRRSLSISVQHHQHRSQVDGTGSERSCGLHYQVQGLFVTACAWTCVGIFARHPFKSWKVICHHMSYKCSILLQCSQKPMRVPATIATEVDGDAIGAKATWECQESLWSLGGASKCFTTGDSCESKLSKLLFRLVLLRNLGRIDLLRRGGLKACLLMSALSLRSGLQSNLIAGIELRELTIFVNHMNHMWCNLQIFQEGPEITLKPRYIQTKLILKSRWLNMAQWHWKIGFKTASSWKTGYFDHREWAPCLWADVKNLGKTWQPWPKMLSSWPYPQLATGDVQYGSCKMRLGN